MKTYTFLFSILLVPFLGFAQDASVQDLKNKVNALELVVKTEQEKNAYLKNALDLRNSGIEVGNGDISMRVTKIIGNTEEQRIYVQGIVTYKGEIRQDLQFQSHDLVSPNGNQ